MSAQHRPTSNNTKWWAEPPDKAESRRRKGVYYIGGHANKATEQTLGKPDFNNGNRGNLCSWAITALCFFCTSFFNFSAKSNKEKRPAVYSATGGWVH